MTEAAPANGSPRGRGGFRGRGGRGRGRGSPSRRFRGGRGHTVHTGTVGRSGPVASRGGSFTGNGRGRGTSRGGPAGQARHRILLTETFLEPRQLREFRTTEKNLSLLIGNLPPIRIQDVQEVYDFIAQCTNVRVQKLSFGTSDKYGFLAAKCVLKNDHQLRECLEKLHGQVFRDHHLIVESATSFHFSPFVQAIKISNLSTTVTVEKLWKLFENCGRPKQIRLIPGTHEASVNFEDSDSLLKAMKLDGATLDNACIKVVVLDKNLSVQINPMDELYLQSVLKDLNIVHITHSVKKNIKTGIVYFSDEESFTAACNLDGKNWDGHTISVKPNFKHNLYLTGSSGHIERLLSEVQSLFNATRSYLLGGRVGVLAFTSKEEADNALKASPVLVGNKSVILYDDLSKIRSSMDGNKDFDRGVHVVSKPSNGVEKLEKQLPKVKAKVEKTLKNNKKQSKKAGVVIGGAVSEPSSLNTVPKQAPQVDGEEEMMKESKKIKRKMKKLTEASGVVSKPSDGVLEKQQSSHTDLKRKRNEPKTHKKTGGKKIKISP